MDDFDKQDALCTKVGFILGIVIILVCALCLAVSNKKEEAAVALEQVAEQEETETPVAENAEAINFDGFSNKYIAYENVFEAIKNNAKEPNVTFSPYSLKLALLLALEGTELDSKTSESILKLVGEDTYNAAEWSKDYRNLLEKDELSITNSIWYDTSIKGLENKDYFKQIQKLYDAEGFEADLDTDDFVKSLNQYVARNTNNLIPIMLSEPLLPESKACILNTLYFKGDWAYPFDDQATHLGTFDTNDSAEIMQHMDSYGYLLGYKGFDIVRLPYKDSSLVMDVYQSAEDADSFDLLTSLRDVDKENLISLADVSLDYDAKVSLTFPKFSTKSRLELKDTLESIGFGAVFGTNAFPKISDDLRIDEILQSAKIIVDEKKTEAAAATAIIMKDNAVAIVDEPIVEIDINKPFIYIIRDLDTNEVIFMGYISNVDER